MNQLEYGIVTVPVAPIRKGPNHRNEMSNQLFFGETVKVLKRRGATWLQVESLYDRYTGWTTQHLITGITADAVAGTPQGLALAPRFLNTITIGGQRMQIPLGASLPEFSQKKGTIAGQPYTFNGQPIYAAAISNKMEALLEQASLWLNAPYLWGGKTILGVDCSGFSQTLYKLIGVPLARDAWQQAAQGRVIRSLKNARPGDLAFFEERGRIVHVGIIWNTGHIIHASGTVRIDPIDDLGIRHAVTRTRTHTLKLIRRLDRRHG